MLEIRAAEPRDAAGIFQLITELADFEQLRHQVIGNAAALSESLFGPAPCIWALVAEWDGAVVGFALYFLSYSTFLCKPGLYLEDLYVRPAVRGKGIGLALLKATEAAARQRGCGRLEWSVLDWNSNAIAFYEAFGARTNAGWTLYRKSLAPEPVDD
jgi:GNAT superfamily N-acetyltransferase